VSVASRTIGFLTKLKEVAAKRHKACIPIRLSCDQSRQQEFCLVNLRLASFSFVRKLDLSAGTGPVEAATDRWSTRNGTGRGVTRAAPLATGVDDRCSCHLILLRLQRSNHYF
jgi:hypothetical protein